MTERIAIHEMIPKLSLICDKFFDNDEIKEACGLLEYGEIRLIVHQGKLKEVIPQPRIRR